LPLDRSLLISDDPARDLYEASLRKMAELGFDRHKVTEAVLTRTRNSFSTSYYLLLYRYGRSQLADASRRIVQAEEARKRKAEMTQ